MKPIYIDFAIKPAYRKIWMLFAAIAACALLVFTRQSYRIHQQNQTLQSQIQQAQTKKSQLPAQNKELTEPQLHPAYSKQASQAAQLLKTDLNKAFTTLETLKIPGVRLQSLTLNVSQNTVEVEFEFAQLSQASDISEALMAGYRKSPWQLISTNAQTRSLLQGAPANSSFTGRWQAKLDQL